MSRPKRKSGGQPGNQNARKHGFYSRVLTPGQLAAFPKATISDALNSELAVLRFSISALLQKDPSNVTLVARGVNAVCRTTAARRTLLKLARKEKSRRPIPPLDFSNE